MMSSDKPLQAAILQSLWGGKNFHSIFWFDTNHGQSMYSTMFAVDKIIIPSCVCVDITTVWNWNCLVNNYAVLCYNRMGITRKYIINLFVQMLHYHASDETLPTRGVPFLLDDGKRLCVQRLSMTTKTERFAIYNLRVFTATQLQHTLFCDWESWQALRSIHYDAADTQAVIEYSCRLFRDDAE